MKRLVFCFDGTWNRLDAAYPTNVVLTAESVVPHADGVTQVIFYDEGVGTGRGERILGGVFGAGLTKNLADAYRFLIFNYTPGDHIFVFGFSRGAYTARSFVGMLLTCGVLERRSAAHVADVINAYRERPEKGGSLEYARKQLGNLFSPNVCVSDEDYQWRCANKEGYGAERCVLAIRYVGVWDTVGALGVPRTFAASSFINRRYMFHNTRLDPRVEFARHAVAIDERREAFEPTLWSDIEQLNSERGKDASDPEAPYQEIWFPGTHGSVGGGGLIRGLSDQSLDWIWDGARLAGLRLDTSKSSRIYELSPSLGVELDNRGEKVGVWTRVLHKLGKRSTLPESDRMPGPAALHQVSVTAQRRWLDMDMYRPRTLARVAPYIEALRDRLQAEPRLSEDLGEYQLYEVKPGDSLTKIAARMLGDASRFPEIVRINSDKIIDPNRIYAGQSLRIPLRTDTDSAGK
jgi:uncharacterized protein (DUF2235 family)